MTVPTQKMVLTINPGSTSTKVAVYRCNELIFLKNIKHTSEDLAKFENIIDQYAFRKEIILQELHDAHIDINGIDAIVGRGGLVKPIPSGVYEVNDRLLEDLKTGVQGQHASNLGGIIAHDLSILIKKAKAYIADPVVVDELDDVARITGHPLFERNSIFHALNQKAIARTHARAIGRKYEDLNLIVVHLGGGISVGAHRLGKVVDVNQALDGDGPFSPERTGTLPVGKLVDLCFSGKYKKEQVKKMIVGSGGFVAYLGTNSAFEVEQRSHAGDAEATRIQEAMAYQVSKEIGAMGAVLEGKIDAILLTGGIAYNHNFVDQIRKRVQHLGPVGVYPGEDEMKALAQNGLMVLNGELQPLVYE
ncbi:MAG: butyrate kinase [Bacteroidetes bacterium GWF2_38_335]|nr:MAG: butyrate kinase [Bacteroidetes bacterium GWF2_38_335]OFY79470.1 MAG: butyrate kinase [Bacteroidetes bacterium RIFOXYA12_FULL_38_20]HBS86594.1 butyrate kinase [Bacteroidales bacterium]